MVNDASLAQHRAANPATSTWLSANAGSGKTKVLIDRVARLLLAGVSPQHILCLTYTKAAATEMQNRLFERLGAWAMMPELGLRAALADLGHAEARHHTAQDLSFARQLFARAIESPGGLRIQTIHSFCATLLRRFPLEAGVSPAFREMDDRAARILREDIIEEMADHLAPDAVQEVARYHSGNDFLGLMAAIARESAGFATPLSMAGALQMFGLRGNETEAGLVNQVMLGREREIVAQLIPHLQAGSVNDQRDAKRLLAVNLDAKILSLMSQLETFFLFGSGAKAFTAKLASFPTKATRGQLSPELCAQLDAFMLRVESARPLRLALRAAQKTAALHSFAAHFLPLYSKAKAARGLLDFDDLIARAIHLLTDRSVAAWVLFRLDGGIDHILVDEAQDTSPSQWRVIELLAEEFTAGASAQSKPRTLFVVGDKKQSIYSFQGANTEIFDKKQHEFAVKFQQTSQPFEPQVLQYSFRSSPAILRVVDEIFGQRFPRAMGDSVQHLAHHETMAGRVDLWPVVPNAEKPDPIDPTDTIPRIAAHSAEWELAQQVAGAIEAILSSRMIIPTKSGHREVTAGDVLVLVQRRSKVFDHIIRACKKLNLPIAGADRLRLGGEMAVRDLSALLRFLATPEDDLSLAAALRSPLLGLDEAQLFDLAQGRSGYLWEALRTSQVHSHVLEILADLRDQADFLRPYDLLERLLTRHEGRHRLIARLGPEAEDGIDELLSQALTFEQGEIPSLTGFLLWLETDDITVKRQMDSGGTQIRVMTVHGAKGLEAPIVFLPDCADRKPRERDEIISLKGGLAWRTNSDESPIEIASAATAKFDASEDERLRLLYVALTRAQSWLIVAAAGEVKSPQTWYNLVKGGMQGAASIAGGVLRYETGEWPQNAAPVAPLAAKAAPVALPDWAQIKVANTPRPAQPFAPSGLTGAKTMGEGEADQGALAFGTAVHTLLEHLPNAPAAEWPALAQRLARDLPEAIAEAMQVLSAADLAHVFASPLAEVTLTAPLDMGQMLGVIDRLVITPSHVLAVDFKTNAAVPASPTDVPEGLLAQMGAYLNALQQIYPNRQVDVAILWTKTGSLMPLDHDMMRAALRRAAIS
jgi:ATP-dependent helicase/nuclease subunit A